MYLYLHCLHWTNFYILILQTFEAHRTIIIEKMARRKVTRTKATPSADPPRRMMVCHGCKSIKQRCERIPGQEACVRCHNAGKPCIEGPSPRTNHRRGSRHPRIGSSSSPRTDRTLEGLQQTDSAPNIPRSSPLPNLPSSETENFDGNALKKVVGMYDQMQVSYGISRGLEEYA